MNAPMVSLRSLLAALIVVTTMSTSAIVQATAVGMDAMFDFSGLCVDCAEEAGVDEYPVTGRLTLTDFVPDVALDIDNFVSFYYTGTNLIPEVTITKDQVFGLQGILAADGTITSDYFAFYGDFLNNGECSNAPASCGFYVYPDAVFQLDRYWVFSDDDFGSDGQFTRVAEPMTLVLIGLGLAGIGCQRSKQIKTA